MYGIVARVVYSRFLAKRARRASLACFESQDGQVGEMSIIHMESGAVIPSQ
jgi:hypothetical protein